MKHKIFRGVRNILEGEPDDWLSKESVQRGLGMVIKHVQYNLNISVSSVLIYTAGPSCSKAGRDKFIRWIRHYSGSKIYFTLNVVQGFHTLPNLTVVRVCIIRLHKRKINTEIFSQIEIEG